MKSAGILIACLVLAAGVPASAWDQLDQEEEVLASAEELKGLSIEELMEIDVTSVTRRSASLSSAAAAISVITREDIRRSGVTSLPEALRLVATLHVARFDGRTWGISARGFNITTANKMLVLIDGRSVYTPLFSGVFWDVQDTLLEDVDRIEVIRGPGATLWGANAVNGVINIITRPAGDTQGGLVTAGAGNEERAFGAVRYGGALGKRGHYRAYAKHFDRDSLAFADGRDAEDPMKMGQGGFRADWQGAGEADWFTVQGDVYRGRVGEPTRADTDVDGGNLLGRWSRKTSESSGMELQVYWDNTYRRVPTVFEEHLDTWDVDFQHQLRAAERHNVIWGLGYRYSRDRVSDSPALAIPPPRRTLELASAFLQDEISLAGDRLRVTVGSKVEHNQSTGFEIQPSVRFAWTPADDRTLWGAVSRAVRTPTRFDEDLVFFTTGGVPFIRGSRDFESEELLAWELGYRWLPLRDLSLDLSAFYHVYDELRSQEPTPGTVLPIVLANKLNAETWGLEGRANWQASQRWRVYFGWALFENDLSFDPDSRDASGGEAEGNDPDYRFTLRSQLDLPGRFELDGWLRTVGELPSPEVPDYTELDLRLGWRATDVLELSLVGQNLLHDQHPEFGPPGPARREVERSVYGKVLWRF
ncbi:MAG TPA: TonB-dependent receptor [Thermoanaerobaculia bacterium]|nr:TonB-dependent receptor [Thermoanaerobaculia bacterium]